MELAASGKLQSLEVIRLRVKFFAFIRDCTGCKEVDFPYEEDIYKLTHALCGRYGKKLWNRMLSEDGENLSPEIIVMINGRHVDHLGGIHAPLKPDDLVQIFPVVAGG